MEDSAETNAELLKNTPSNIARLEDEIEHCKGRQKYLAQTRSPSDGGDVRWYFSKFPLLPNELAASVPSTEIVGKSDYFRFGMRDSLAIEASFLQREEELLSNWWKEYAECSEGPRERASSIKKSDVQASLTESVRSAELYEVEEERVGVPVKGGLYEVDLVRRHCFPVYWNGDNRRVLRGHWFARKGGLDWLPIREDVAEQLEIAYRSQVWHRRTFQPSGLFAARVDLQGSTPGLHALFTGEDDTWEAWLNVDASGFSSIISFSGNGIKLRRGYSQTISANPSKDELRQQKEEEMDDYCSQVPVRHLVFMVHGIGQRLEKSNLVDDVGNFRHITVHLAERHLTLHQRGTQRVLFIPCQWRKGLKLSSETAVEKITLDGVRGLRVMLSATVHDVLYYMSPIYCQDIINSVSNQLNRLYLKFLKRNPGYDGKVSIYGHSLGSVLSYDILCHQENLSSPFPMDCLYKERAGSEESSPDMNNQPSRCNSSTNLENNISTMMNDTREKVNPADEDTMSVQSTQVMHEGNSEDLSPIMGSVISDSGDITATAMVSERIGDNDVQEMVHGSSDTFFAQNDGLNEATYKDFGVKDMEKMIEEDCLNTSDKDKTINLLIEEIGSLKSRIAELESKCDGNGLSENYEALPNNPEQPSPDKLPSKLDDAPKSYTPYVNYTKLEFKVDTFFAVGSPLGVFLALRNIRIGVGKGQEYWAEENVNEEMPACRQMFNIFHPFDPVAYRIEPLVCKEYLDKCPVFIPYHKGGKRLHIGFREFTEDLAAHSQAISNHFNSVRVKVLTACQSRNADGIEEEEEHGQENEERSYGSIMMERLTGSQEGRIDHMLQDKTFEHPYLQAIGSHTNYWRDEDTALFILKHLYRDIPEDPNSPMESGGDNSKGESGSTGWSDQREYAEEELPLTFSDRAVVRSFSRRAKKFIKKR
ncbi:phospholipase SGR2 [Citrus sinensis]|uniref:phospholipase SGR2 isoform X1 n=1 Tax=Citrus sinensis TaxID=2711 RepID=UPI00219ED46E|nr:phospholipase SGR2 isoform X1 [Citrus sinensis]KAH9725510.1 phospholipase SGR2 [Citrus sinensis]